MKKLFLGAMALLAAVTLVACGSKKDAYESIKENKKLVVAVSPDYAPFEFKTLVDGKDQVVGSDIKLAQAIADELGVKLEVTTMSFDNVLSSLQAGKADIAISGISVTDERKKTFDFSDPYYETQNAIIVRKDQESTYSSLDAFKGKKAGEEVKFNAVKAYPNKTDFAAMLGVTKEEAEHAGENYCFIVKEIKRYIDAEVNEELFTKLYGEGVVKDAADFRNRVKADIENQLKGHSEYRFTIDAKEKLIKKNEDVVLPETFLKRWIVAVNEKMTPEEVEKDFEGYRDEFKWQLVKSAIVKDYDVKVEAEDMKREGRQIAAAQLQQYGLYGLTDEQLDGFAAKLLEDEKQRQHLYERALDNKVFDVIRENVKLEEQEISMADFEKLFQK